MKRFISSVSFLYIAYGNGPRDQLLLSPPNFTSLSLIQSLSLQKRGGGGWAGSFCKLQQLIMSPLIQPPLSHPHSVTRWGIGIWWARASIIAWVNDQSVIWKRDDVKSFWKWILLPQLPQLPLPRWERQTAQLSPSPTSYPQNHVHNKIVILNN